MHAAAKNWIGAVWRRMVLPNLWDAAWGVAWGVAWCCLVLLLLPSPPTTDELDCLRNQQFVIRRTQPPHGIYFVVCCALGLGFEQ